MTASRGVLELVHSSCLEAARCRKSGDSRGELSDPLSESAELELDTSDELLGGVDEGEAGTLIEVANGCR